MPYIHFIQPSSCSEKGRIAAQHMNLRASCPAHVASPSNQAACLAAPSIMSGVISLSDHQRTTGTINWMRPIQS